MIYQLLDRLAERYSEREHKLEAMRAREEYFDRAGKVFDDDAELFEGRMASFLEWYVLERPLGQNGDGKNDSKNDGGSPPVLRALQEAALSSGSAGSSAAGATPGRAGLGSGAKSAAKRSAKEPAKDTTKEAATVAPGAGRARPVEERQALAALATSHRSLFQLFTTEDRVLDIEDVIGGARFTVHERRRTVGISPGDLFEARLIWDGSAVVFGRTFLFHPPDAREVVLDWVERAVGEGVARDEILFHLSRQHVRWHRLGHVGAARVYRDA
jgi:hypothetical protein